MFWSTISFQNYKKVAEALSCKVLKAFYLYWRVVWVAQVGYPWSWALKFICRLLFSFKYHTKCCFVTKCLFVLFFQLFYSTTPRRGFLTASWRRTCAPSAATSSWSRSENRGSSRTPTGCHALMSKLFYKINWQ